MEAWPSIEEVHRAAIACSKKKRKRYDAIAFRAKHGEEVLNLTRRLQTGAYAPECGMVFVIDCPKYREIHAAYFRDRVVHHLLHSQLEPVFERSFISDSYACRKGKGTHAAICTLHRKMREITRQGQIKAYALQLDIKAFFPSIQKEILFNFIKSRESSFLFRKKIIDLTKMVINHDMANSARRIGNPALFKLVPQHKRLGRAGYGLPIGNLTSQFFGNVYLNALDQFVKRTLGVRHYLRYVDDVVLLHTDQSQLLIWEKQIRKFLAERLLLQLHENFRVLPVSSGIDFLGYVVRPNYILPRDRVINHAHQRITELESGLKSKNYGSYQVWPINNNVIQQLRSSWASYGGHFKHADSYRTIRRLWQRHPISRFYLTLSSSFKPRFARFQYDFSWRRQVCRLSAGTKKAILLVQVGSYIECPSHYDQKRLNIPWMNMLSKKKSGWRYGRLRVGAPRKLLQKLLKTALDKGLSVALAFQRQERVGRLKARELKYFFEPQLREGAAN